MTQENTLLNALEREIEDELRSIRDSAREQGEAIVANARRRLRKQQEHAAVRIEEEARLQLRKALTRRETHNRNRLLELKRQETDRVLAALGERLERLVEEDPERFAKLMEAVFRRCRRLLPEGRVVVVLDPGVQVLKDSFAHREEVTIEEKAGIQGILVTTENGRQRSDGTLPGLIAGLRRRKEAEIQRLLFGEEA